MKNKHAQALAKKSVEVREKNLGGKEKLADFMRSLNDRTKYPRKDKTVDSENGIVHLD